MAEPLRPRLAALVSNWRAREQQYRHLRPGDDATPDTLRSCAIELETELRVSLDAVRGRGAGGVRKRSTMRYITVTTLIDGTKLRINTESLDAWEPGHRGGTVIRWKGGVVEVTEPPEDIDKMIDKPEP